MRNSNKHVLDTYVCNHEVNSSEGASILVQLIVEERDPHWKKARDLTTGAEQASKLSAAKVC